ncbi:hypothetical protein FKP32DRAFT_1600296 [Trametes sanguinea]|nr:hypothetical protein FKP32DRAFT_1600296 [Trametes sanguinea]
MPVSTRSSNSENHPGVVDAPNPRRSHDQVKAAKAAKEAEGMKRKLRDRKREETLAKKEIEMAAEEKVIRQSREKHSERAAGKRKRESKNSSTNKSSKRKSKDDEAQESLDDAGSQSDAPTPSPYVTQTESESESELSEPIGGWSSSEDGIAVEETPKPPKKKAKKAADKVKESLRQRVEAVKTGLAEFDVDMADAVSEAPTSSSTATQKNRSRISAWAAGMTKTASSTPLTAKPRTTLGARTIAVPPTPYAAALEEKKGKKNDTHKLEADAARSNDRDHPKGVAKAAVKVRPRAVKVKAEPVSDAEVVEQGFVGTEDEGMEAAAAEASPVKNGVRKTSEAIVRAQDVDLTSPTKPKGAVKGAMKRVLSVTSTATASSSAAFSESGSQGKPIQLDLDDLSSERSSKKSSTGKSRVLPRNGSLPEGAHHNSLWKAKFLPTFIKALGTREDPWNVPDVEMVALLQSIWNAVYEDQPRHTVKVNDVVHALATQRMYEWRSAFGSAAKDSFESFFASLPADFPDIQSRQQFCASIKSGRVFFKDPEGSSKQGLYRSPFVIAALAVHMNAINGAIEVQGLYSTVSDQYPYGAIGLAAAAAYRMCVLWDLGKLGYNDSGQLRLINDKDSVSGKVKKKDTDFSSNNFSRTTSQCARSARKLQPTSLDQIVDDAYVCAKIAAPRRSSSNANTLDREVNFEDLVEARTARLLMCITPADTSVFAGVDRADARQEGPVHPFPPSSSVYHCKRPRGQLLLRLWSPSHKNYQSTRETATACTIKLVRTHESFSYQELRKDHNQFRGGKVFPSKTETLGSSDLSRLLQPQIVIGLKRSARPPALLNEKNRREQETDWARPLLPEDPAPAFKNPIRRRKSIPRKSYSAKDGEVLSTMWDSFALRPAIPETPEPGDAGDPRNALPPPQDVEMGQQEPNNPNLPSGIQYPNLRQPREPSQQPHIAPPAAPPSYVLQPDHRGVPEGQLVQHNVAAAVPAVEPPIQGHRNQYPTLTGAPPGPPPPFPPQGPPPGYPNAQGAVPGPAPGHQNWQFDQQVPAPPHHAPEARGEGHPVGQVYPNHQIMVQRQLDPPPAHQNLQGDLEANGMQRYALLPPQARNAQPPQDPMGHQVLAQPHPGYGGHAPLAHPFPQPAAGLQPPPFLDGRHQATHHGSLVARNGGSYEGHPNVAQSGQLLYASQDGRGHAQQGVLSVQHTHADMANQGAIQQLLLQLHPALRQQVLASLMGAQDAASSSTSAAYYHEPDEPMDLEAPQPRSGYVHQPAILAASQPPPNNIGSGQHAQVPTARADGDRGRPQADEMEIDRNDGPRPDKGKQRATAAAETAPPGVSVPQAAQPNLTMLLIDQVQTFREDLRVQQELVKAVKGLGQKLGKVDGNPSSSIPLAGQNAAVLPTPRSKRSARASKAMSMRTQLARFEQEDFTAEIDAVVSDDDAAPMHSGSGVSPTKASHAPMGHFPRHFGVKTAIPKIPPTTPREEALMLQAMSKEEKQDPERTFVLRLQFAVRAHLLYLLKVDSLDQIGAKYPSLTDEELAADMPNLPQHRDITAESP